jgi:hypothetical protein
MLEVLMNSVKDQHAVYIELLMKRCHIHLAKQKTQTLRLIQHQSVVMPILQVLMVEPQGHVI